jgi:hypothetical protein
MNTVDILLASVEFGDGPFALANMFKIQRFLASQQINLSPFHCHQNIVVAEDACIASMISIILFVAHAHVRKNTAPFDSLEFP